MRSTTIAVPRVIAPVTATPLMPAAAIVPGAPETHIADALQIEPCLANGLAARTETMEHMVQVSFGAIDVLVAILLSLGRHACHRSGENKRRHAHQERSHPHGKVPPMHHTATPCVGEE